MTAQAGRARPRRADPTRPGRARRRGRVSIPAPAHAGRGLRGASEDRPRGTPRALRRLARRADGGVVELDEIVGYHFEQAARYRHELGLPADDVAARAGERLATAGRRALWREDRPAAAALLERALSLTRPLRLDVLLEVDLAETSFINDSRWAAAIVESAANRAAAQGDAVAETFARAIVAYHRFNVQECSLDEFEALTLAAVPLLEATQDHAALVHVWNALGIGIASTRGRWADHVRAAECALEQAQLAGQSRTGLFFLDIALALGPTPAGDALQRLDRLLPQSPAPYTLGHRAVLLAMLDRFDEAWPLAREANAWLQELDGRRLGEARLAEIAVLAGDHRAAAAHLRPLCAWLEERNQPGLLSTFAPTLGCQLVALGCFEEAEALAARGRELGQEEDMPTQTLWRQAQALVHAHRGEHAEAARLGHEAVAITERTDGLNHQGDALCALAEVRTRGGPRRGSSRRTCHRPRTLRAQGEHPDGSTNAHTTHGATGRDVVRLTRCFRVARLCDGRGVGPIVSRWRLAALAP